MTNPQASPDGTGTQTDEVRRALDTLYRMAAAQYGTDRLQTSPPPFSPPKSKGSQDGWRVLEAALQSAVKVAAEAARAWDAAPPGMRAGKLLIALSGGLRGYRADIDAIRRPRLCRRSR
jgi:hypothetical protein